MTHRIAIIARHVDLALTQMPVQCSPTAQLSNDAVSTVDVAVVGAGMAGMYALHKLSELGMCVRVFEKGHGVGGTWFWNRYPGAQCDVESLQYGYTFSNELRQEWSWSRRYSPQPEILKYLDHVADRFKLRNNIELSVVVTSCVWDDAMKKWKVALRRANGTTNVVWAKFVVMATGCLTERNWPTIPGISQFAGRMLHTQDWPEEPINFANRRVGVIGTGSSGVQLITKIAPETGQLFVFQRTPCFVVPARNAAMSQDKEAKVKAAFSEWSEGMRNTASAQYLHGTTNLFATATDEDRIRVFEERWQMGGFPYLAAFADMSIEKANQFSSDFIRRKIRHMVKDPSVADVLCPKYLLACKRVCVADGYYETYNRDNVTLVDLQTCGGQIDEVTQHGVRIAGSEYVLDDLICATGFDAMTGALTVIDICGRDGVLLRNEWLDGAHTYLGLACAGFPNLFTVNGPQSPSVLTNMPLSIEHHVDWITECICYIQRDGKQTIEATRSAQDKWVSHCNQVSAMTLSGSHPSCGNSWYSGANIDGKPRAMLPYIGGFGQPAGVTPWPSYRDRCAAVAANGYSGFSIV